MKSSERSGEQLSEYQTSPTERIEVQDLTQAQETLLIPLWARAVEATQAEPILKDDKAVELVKRIDYPFQKFSKAQVDRAGFCIRGAIIDQLVTAFLRLEPNATVVEIGAGLDTRFDRLDNGNVAWWDIDLPKAMAVRQRLIPSSERRRMISASVLESEWLDELESTSPQAILFVAEGMLFFLQKLEVIRLLCSMADRFPGARFIFDCQSPLFLAYNNWKQPIANAKMLWAVRSESELRTWDRRFAVEHYIRFGDLPYYQSHHIRRLSSLQRCIYRLWSPAREMFKICQLRLGEPR